MRSRGLGRVADPWGLSSGSWSRWDGEPRQAVGGLGAGDGAPDPATPACLLELSVTQQAAL